MLLKALELWLPDRGSLLQLQRLKTKYVQEARKDQKGAVEEKTGGASQISEDDTAEADLEHLHEVLEQRYFFRKSFSRSITVYLTDAWPLVGGQDWQDGRTTEKCCPWRQCEETTRSSACPTFQGC